MSKPKAEQAPPAIEWRKADGLKPYERNAKTHSDEQIAQIAASIIEFGFTMPLLIDEQDGIKAGHGRDLAAALLYKQGKTFKMFDGTPVPVGMVPVIVARGWTEAQFRAYVIADNKLTENGGWDADLLKSELVALQGMNFNVALTGFEEKELVTFLAGAGGGDGNEKVPDAVYSEQYGVIVICESEAEQAKMYERLSGEGLKVRVVTT